MSLDILKLYSLKVANGSGCFFQPMTNEYTYILTAKHLFYEKPPGQNDYVEFEKGKKIDIFKHQKNGNNWKEIKIPFELDKGVNYFPHPNDDVDIVILKVDFISGYDSIFIQENSSEEKKFELCGFPVSHQQNNEGERCTTQTLEKFGVNGNYYQEAQLFGTLQQQDIEGYSGCGLLKVSNDNIYIVGIQSKMASKAINKNGKIGFVQIKHFDDIIDNSDSLEKLFPNYMSNFSFLRNDVFLLEVDALDEGKIENTRMTLRNKAESIINSDVTPIGIKELFKEKILLNNNDSEQLSIKNVWIAWIEFLTIMNILKYENIQMSSLSEIFNSFRLKYADVDDWTSSSFIRNDLLKSDYLGLKQDSTIVISTRKAPKRNFKLPRETLINITQVPDRRGFKTDKGIYPFSAFNFVHLEFFKIECIVERLEKYENINDEIKLLNIFKQQYDELYS